MRNFRELKIWQKGMEIVKGAYAISEAFPSHEKFGITSQINRSAVSIPSNIAEGSSKASQKEFNRFLEISAGSSFELETQLLIVQEIGWVNEDNIKDLLDKLVEFQKMISVFMKNMSK